MHILHLTPYYAPAYAFGGVTRAVTGMARALARRGHTVTVLTTDALDRRHRSAGPASMITADGVRVVRVRNLTLWTRRAANLSTPLAIRRAARTLIAEADLVHAHELRTLENLLVTPLLDHGQRPPLILSPHGTLTTATGRGRFKQVWDRFLSGSVARRTNAVIGLTTDEIADAESLWRQLGAQSAMHIVPNGVDLAELTGPDCAARGAAFRQRYDLGADTICLFMGRLHARKGVDVLIRAFRWTNHKADLPGTRLVIAGPDEGMGAQIAPLLDDRIVLTGYLDSDARLGALAAADVFALPAVGEGLSLAALEALGAGLPVILTPGCHLPEVAAVGAGLIVEPETVPLAQALHALLSDAERRRAMGAAAQALIRERYTWDAVAAQLETIYAGLISPDRRSTSAEAP
ncbi:MAG: glycosyltransferase [Chloroflexi bacterium]|nr:glycosyltransferase [Chloroflexota bacterium]